jgi:hypothetical protein
MLIIFPTILEAATLPSPYPSFANLQTTVLDERPGNRENHVRHQKQETRALLGKAKNPTTPLRGTE